MHLPYLEEVTLDYKLDDIPDSPNGLIVQAPQGYNSPYIRIARKGDFFTVSSGVLFEDMFVPDHKVVWVVHYDDRFKRNYQSCITSLWVTEKVRLEHPNLNTFTIEHLLIACATFGLFVMYPSVYEGYYHLP